MNDSLKGISTCLRGAILEEKHHIFIIYSSYNNIDKDILVKKRTCKSVLFNAFLFFYLLISCYNR